MNKDPRRPEPDRPRIFIDRQTNFHGGIKNGI